MATTIQINPQDATDAAAFLEQFLADQIPLGDFSKGTALRDLTIGALAAIFAYLTHENDLIRARQSLNTIEGTFVDAEPASLLDAVTALLSNFFITPNSGTKARGVAIGHASQQVDIFIQPTQRFVYNTGTTFNVDATDTYFIPAVDLLPVIDATGLVTDWLFRIPLICTTVGNAGNIDPGLFSGFDPFSPYVTRVEAQSKFSGGNPPETTQQVLARAPTAVSVRNLINSRSIQAVLGDNFSDSIKQVLVIRYGDPEMVRDRIDIASHLAIHVGGAVDIFVLLDTVEKTTSGVVGGPFLRPDGISSVFYDETRQIVLTGQNLNALGVVAGDLLTISADAASSSRNGVYTVTGLGALGVAFVAEAIPGAFETTANASVKIMDSTATVTRLAVTPFVPLLSRNRVSMSTVQPGDILRIVSGFPAIPLEFSVRSVSSDGFSLFVSERFPFPYATDETTPTYLSWTLGRIGPSFNDVLALPGGQPIIKGRASRTVQREGRTTLPGEPLMDILDVAITDPSPLTDSAYVDPGDGLVHFPNRINAPPSAPVGDPLQYQLIVNNPDQAQTALQWAEVLVNSTEPKAWDGRTLRVRYLGLATFQAIDSFVRDTKERTVAASQLVKGHYPMRVRFSVTYRLVRNASTFTDPVVIAQSLVDYVNGFDTVDSPATISGILTFLRSSYPEIDSFVFPTMQVNTVLSAPTGDVLVYDNSNNSDALSPDQMTQISGPTLNLAALGVSNRTIRYVAKLEDINLSIL